MSSAPATQPASRSVPKVLRIGVVREGKVIQERILRIGEVVTAGELSKNTFVVPDSKLGKGMELFIPRGDGYVLNVPDGTDGKVSWRDGIKGLDELRAAGEGTKKGDVWQLPLNENVRGKVVLGSTTVLFQFVPAPPEPVRAMSAADFRPRFFDDDDPLFLGLLGAFTIVAAALMTWVYVTPLPERLDLDQVAAAVDLIVEKPIEQVELPPPDDQGPDKPNDQASTKPAKDASPQAAQEAQSKTPSLESVTKKSALLQLIGTTGEGAGAVADILGEDAASTGSLDAALAGVNGVELANSQNAGLRSGAGKIGDARVGVQAGTGGTASTGSAGAIAVRPKVRNEAPSTQVEAGSEADILSVVKSNKGRIESCLQQALKQDPKLNGRVAAGWTITQGRVSDVSVVKNTTGNDELGQCIARAVRGFRFKPEVSATVDEFPWVVSGE